MSETKIRLKPWEFMEKNKKIIGNFMPQSVAIGFEYTKIEFARAWSVLPFNEKIMGDKTARTTALGAIVCMIDQTCGAAFMAAIDAPGSFATLNLRLDTMREPKPEATIYCRAHCYEINDDVAFMRAECFDDAKMEELFCTATSCFMSRAPSQLKKGDA